MAPQPAAKEKEPDTATTDDAAAEYQDLIAAATGDDADHAEGTRQVKRAIQLYREMVAARTNLNGCRDLLRSLRKNEGLNQDQEEFVDVFFPDKERGTSRSQDEINASKKLHDVAVKNGQQD